MRRCLQMWMCVGLFVMCFSVVQIAARQVSYDVRFQAATVELDGNISVLRQWERDALWSFWIMIAIALAGATTVLIQATSTHTALAGRVWPRVATGIAGAIVSLATAFNGAMLDGDFKTLNRRATDGRFLMDSASRWLETRTAAQTDADREQILREVETRITSFARLRSGGGEQSRTEQSASLFPSLTAVLHAAAPAKCGCDTLRRGEPGFVYACGTAQDGSLSDAREEATSDAIDRMATLLDRTSKDEDASSEVVDYARRVASEVDSCAAPNGKGFTFAVMLRVPESLAARGAQTAFVAPAAAPAAAAAPVRVPDAAGESAVRATPQGGIQIPVRANPPQFGDFVFTFAPRQGSPRVLELRSIRVNEDGSVGRTRWAFTILVNGAPVSTIAEQNYSDDPKPSIYKAIASVPLQGSAPQVKVLGYRR
jgi:hypothetical protein